MSKSASATRSRLGRAAISLGTTSVLIGATLGVVALTANADEVPESPEYIQGNITTCEDAGLAGIKLEDPDDGTDHPGIEYTYNEDGTLLFVTVNDDTLLISGTVVKGGPDTYVWHGDPEQYSDGMYAPDNPGGNRPAISHWFICGTEVEPTDEPTNGPTDEPTNGPTDEPTEEPTAGPTDEPTEEPTVEPTDAPSPEEPGDDDEGEELPDTGAGTGAALGAALLLAGGAALTLYGRRVSRQSI